MTPRTRSTPELIGKSGFYFCSMEFKSRCTRSIVISQVAGADVTAWNGILDLERRSV